MLINDLRHHKILHPAPSGDIDEKVVDLKIYIKIVF